MERRLAAILAADVVGYSRLMGLDEAATLSAWKSHRSELVDPKITEHRGRIVKLTGDGLLVDFPSVVDALACAAEIQRGMVRRNENVPHDRRIELRIGINLGDVLLEDGDVFGDGVNIAARLEGIADPGGIVVSATVRDHVGDRLGLQFEDLGNQNLKNITRPIRAFRVRWDGTAPTEAVTPDPLPLPDKPSIAVLPFQNMSGDPDQDYLADGIVEDIITALYRVRWLFVIARNSSFVYKGRPVDVRQVGRELGVRFVLEGSVRRAGRRIRITGQLIDSTTGGHVWADRFDSDANEIFELQDRITESVVGAIEPAIRLVEVQRARNKPTESLDAYDNYLRALPLHYSNKRHKLHEAQSLLERAIEIDPTYSTAKAFSALTTVVQTNQGWADEVGKAKGIRLAREALSDQRDDPVVLRCVGHSLAYLAREYDAAISILDRALVLNPNSAEVHHSAGWVWNFTCDGSKAGGHFQRAIRHNPLNPEIGHSLMGLTFSQILTGHYEDALTTARSAAAAMPTSLSPVRAQIIALVELARYEDARSMGRRLLDMNPRFRISDWEKDQPFAKDWFVERYKHALRTAKLPE